MALKVIHLLAVSAISLTIYGYASYYSAPSTPLRAAPTLSLVDRNGTIQPEQDWSRQTSGTNSTITNITIPSSLPSVVTIPTEKSNVTSKPQSTNHQQDLNKGIKTRTFYVAGHDVPRPEVCPDLGAHLKLLIMIMSAPSHFDARMAIRQTWGHFTSRSDVAMSFLLGTTEDAKLESVIEEEGWMYSDIVRGRFLDSYNNLTLKTVSMMEWVSDYCPKARFAMKTDDDMFINIPKLLNFTDKHANDKNVIFGRLAKRWKPIRNQKSKYFVSRNQYRPALFPDFMTGPAYILPGNLARDLYKTALDQTYLKLEDVFMTGVVAQKLKIKRFHAAEFLNKRVPMNACTVQRAISIHMVKFSEQFDLWKKLLDGKAKCK